MADLTVNAGTAFQLQNGEQQFLDANGNLLAGGLVYMYVPETTTPKTTWVDPQQSTPNTNPIILDSRGRCIIWGTGLYRQVVTDSTGADLMWDQLVGADEILAATSGTEGFPLVSNGPGVTPSYQPLDLAGPGVTGILPNSHLEARQLIASATTFYVSPTGNDLNSGTSIPDAWATLTHAWEYLVANVDIAQPDGSVTVSVQPGAYDPLEAEGLILGSGGRSVTFEGDIGTPSTVTIAANANANAVHAKEGAIFTFKGFALSAFGTTGTAFQGVGVLANTDSRVTVSNVEWSTCIGAHMSAEFGGRILATGLGTITSDSPRHAIAGDQGAIVFEDLTLTLSGTPDFSDAFAQTTDLGLIVLSTDTVFSGSATGKRFSAVSGIIDVQGQGANAFPGNAAGTTGPYGGYYVP